MLSFWKTAPLKGSDRPLEGSTTLPLKTPLLRVKLMERGLPLKLLTWLDRPKVILFEKSAVRLPPEKARVALSRLST